MNAWFTEQETLKYRLGLEFDASIRETHPETNASLPEMHGGYCPICYEELNEETSFALACGHTFCVECWKDYLTTKVQAGPEGVDALCQQVNCNMKVPHSQFVNFLGKKAEDDGNPATLEKYWKWLCKNYTDDNKNV